MDLLEELTSLLQRLDQEGLDYALCGGLALAVHGHPRFTKDIDLLIRAEDVERALAVVDQLGFSYPAKPMTFGHGEEQRAIQRVSKLEDGETLMLDLLLLNPRLAAIWQTRQHLALGEQVVQVVSREGLIAMKRIANRPQDRLDIEQLRGDDVRDADAETADG